MPPSASYDRTVMAEGFASEVFVTLTGGAFLTGLALHLGAGPIALALLASLPFLCQSAQLAAPMLERRLGSRRRFVVPAAFAARLLWLVPAALAALNARGDLALGAAIAAVLVLSLLGMVAQNGWIAWLADLVPGERQVALFGRRAWAVSAATLVATPCGAVALDHLSGQGRAGLALGLLGCVAVIGGVGSTVALSRMPEVAHAPGTERLAPHLRRVTRDPAFRRVLALFSLWHTAIGLPAPFWALYMINMLDMSFLLITVHVILSLTLRLLTSNAWARLIERVGSRRVLIACAFVLTFNPVLWLLAKPDTLWPIWLEGCVSGVAWTGFNQAAFIQPIAILAPRDRSVGLAIFSLVTGAALFAASLTGGVVLEVLGGARGAFLLLFVVSAALRAVTGVAALRLSEPGVSLRAFFVSFVGHGMLRRPAGRLGVEVAPAPSTADEAP